MYVQDTDTLTLYHWGHPQVCPKVDAQLPQDIAITVITVDEQLSGWYRLVRQAKNPKELAHAYARLGRTVTFLGRWQILSLTETAIARAKSLSGLKLGIGAADIRIAAIALEHDATVVTRNLRDFQRVPGLKVEDWSV